MYLELGKKHELVDWDSTPPLLNPGHHAVVNSDLKKESKQERAQCCKDICRAEEVWSGLHLEMLCW